MSGCLPVRSWERPLSVDEYHHLLSHTFSNLIFSYQAIWQSSHFNSSTTQRFNRSTICYLPLSTSSYRAKNFSPLQIHKHRTGGFQTRPYNLVTSHFLLSRHPTSHKLHSNYPFRRRDRCSRDGDGLFHGVGECFEQRFDLVMGVASFQNLQVNIRFHRS